MDEEALGASVDRHEIGAVIHKDDLGDACDDCPDDPNTEDAGNGTAPIVDMGACESQP